MSAILVRSADSDMGLDQQEGHEVAEPKESAFNDPRFWVSVTAVLLTLTLFVLTLIANQLTSINAKMETSNVANGRQDERVKVLEDENREQRIDIKALQKANVDRAERDSDYRYTIGKDLTEIKTRLGMKKE